MTSFECKACSRTFASPYALKRHISDKHRNHDISDDDDGPSEMPYEEPGLWTDDDDNVETSKVTYQEEPDLWDIDNDNDDSKDKNKMVSNNFIISWILTEYI
jgi:Zinc-finger double-stranded RNA-binding